MDTAPQTPVLNTLLQRFAGEAQSLVLIFRAALSNLPDPTATPLRPPRPLRAQWETFLLMHASLRTALGVQSRRNEEVEQYLAQIGALVRELTAAGPNAERNADVKKRLDASFSADVLGLLTAEKGEVQARLTSLGVGVATNAGPAVGNTATFAAVARVPSPSVPPSVPLPKAPMLGTNALLAPTEAVTSTGNAEMTPPAPPPLAKPASPPSQQSFSRSASIEPIGTSRNQSSSSDSNVPPTDTTPSKKSPHTTALEDKIRQLDQLSGRRSPSPATTATPPRMEPTREPPPAAPTPTPTPVPTTAPPPIPSLSRKPVRGSVPQIPLPSLPFLSTSIPQSPATESAPFTPLEPKQPRQPKIQQQRDPNRASPSVVKGLEALAAELDAFASSVGDDDVGGENGDAGEEADVGVSSAGEQDVNVQAMDNLHKSASMGQSDGQRSTEEVDALAGEEQAIDEEGSRSVAEIVPLADITFGITIDGQKGTVPLIREEEGTGVLKDPTAPEKGFTSMGLVDDQNAQPQKADAPLLRPDDQLPLIDSQKATELLTSMDDVVKRLSMDVQVFTVETGEMPPVPDIGPTKSQLPDLVFATPVAGDVNGEGVQGVEGVERVKGDSGRGMKNVEKVKIDMSEKAPILQKKGLHGETDVSKPAPILQRKIPKGIADVGETAPLLERKSSKGVGISQDEEGNDDGQRESVSGGAPERIITGARDIARQAILAAERTEERNSVAGRAINEIAVGDEVTSAQSSVTEKATVLESTPTTFPDEEPSVQSSIPTSAAEPSSTFLPLRTQSPMSTMRVTRPTPPQKTGSIPRKSVGDQLQDNDRERVQASSGTVRGAPGGGGSSSLYTRKSNLDLFSDDRSEQESRNGNKPQPEFTSLRDESPTPTFSPVALRKTTPKLQTPPPRPRSPSPPPVMPDIANETAPVINVRRAAEFFMMKQEAVAASAEAQKRRPKDLPVATRVGSIRRRISVNDEDVRDALGEGLIKKGESGRGKATPVDREEEGEARGGNGEVGGGVEEEEKAREEDRETEEKAPPTQGASPVTTPTAESPPNPSELMRAPLVAIPNIAAPILNKTPQQIPIITELAPSESGVPRVESWRIKEDLAGNKISAEELTGLAQASTVQPTEEGLPHQPLPGSLTEFSDEQPFPSTSQLSQPPNAGLRLSIPVPATAAPTLQQAPPLSPQTSDVSLLDDIQTFKETQRANKGRRRSTISGIGMKMASDVVPELPQEEPPVIRKESVTQKCAKSTGEANDEGSAARKETSVRKPSRDRAQTLSMKLDDVGDFRGSLPQVSSPPVEGVGERGGDRKKEARKSMPASATGVAGDVVSSSPNTVEAPKWGSVADLTGGERVADIERIEPIPASALSTATTGPVELQPTSSLLVPPQPGMTTSPSIGIETALTVSPTQLFTSTKHPLTSSEPPDSLPKSPSKLLGGLERAGRSQSSPALLNSASQLEAFGAVYEEPPQLLLIPMNGTFDVTYLDLTYPHRFGRSNTGDHPHFKYFPSQVVSRNHAEVVWRNKRVYIRDIGSNSGTFVNGVRISDAGVESELVEIKNWDYVQLGRDFLEDSAALEGAASGKEAIIDDRHKCVKMQIMITAAENVDAQQEQVQKEADEIVESTEDIMGEDKYSPPPARSSRRPSVVSPEGRGSVVGPQSPVTQPESSFAIGFSPQQKRAKHVIAVTCTGGKPKKVHVATESGTEVFSVGLKAWETRRLITIQDLRPTYQQANPSLEIYPSSQSNITSSPAFVITSATGAELATLQYANNLKLNLQFSPSLAPIMPTLPSTAGAAPSMPTLARPGRGGIGDRRRSSTVSYFLGTSVGNSMTSLDSPASPMGSGGNMLFPTNPSSSSPDRFAAAAFQCPVLSLTGDLPAQKYIMILKHPHTREQRFFGEASGKQTVRTNMVSRESRCMFAVETEEGERSWNQIVLAAVVFVAITGGEDAIKDGKALAEARAISGWGL
ncbi:hypothetical protein HDV00_008489 [Rhizophlyctis rosea]|nr:hypothetical protein HDV00_008489 [Rhizophlyctis rosea]